MSETRGETFTNRGGATPWTTPSTILNERKGEKNSVGANRIAFSSSNSGTLSARIDLSKGKGDVKGKKGVETIRQEKEGRVPSSDVIISFARQTSLEEM
jgi:hypothetical protein